MEAHNSPATTVMTGQAKSVPIQKEPPDTAVRQNQVFSNPKLILHWSLVSMRLAEGTCNKVIGNLL